MAFSHSPSAIRCEFLHRLATVSQQFVGHMLVLEPDEFCNRVAQLVAEVPEPASAAEAIVAFDRLTAVIARGGDFHHRWFHRWFGTYDCRFEPTPFGAADSFCWSAARARLIEWSHAYATAFERSHRWPPAVRAARLMRLRMGTTWYIDDLADDVAASTATLERNFRRIYGLTAQHYHSRLRLRTAALLIRDDPQRCIESVALEVGYTSVKDIYRAFRIRTGRIPGDVRHLSNEDFSSLMAGALELPVPGFGNDRPGLDGGAKLRSRGTEIDEKGKPISVAATTPRAHTGPRL